MNVDDDRIGSSWRNPGIGRMEWLMIITLGVMLGGLLHDGARLLIANAVAKYHLEQFKAEQAKAQQRLQQQQTANEVARIRAAEAAERQRKLSSDECKFWSQQHEQNPSEKAAGNMFKYCR